MRTVFLALPLFFLAACGQQQEAAEQPAPQQEAAAGNAPLPEQLPPPPPPPPGPQEGFDVQTVRITYRVEGPHQGTSTVWIEDQGLRAAAHDRITDYSGPVNQQIYWDGSRAHFRNVTSGTVAHSTFLPSRFQPAAVADLPEERRALVGYLQTEERMVAGKPCQVWRNAAARIELCVWQGVSLQEFVEEGPAQYRRIATEIVEGERIPDEIRALAQ